MAKVPMMQFVSRELKDDEQISYTNSGLVTYTNLTTGETTTYQAVRECGTWYIEETKRGQSVGYGEYGCCKCKAPLKGSYSFVRLVEDDEGYEWRSFCNECWSKIQHLTDSEILHTYRASTYLY